ncbi:RDD family protein [Streptomyces sp. NPDC053560]|uniref:RDD family protein n=1 Tax=Streptomyces sp. NPDC053560 TaxID=3365711 RepID=UPI0037D5BC7C
MSHPGPPPQASYGYPPQQPAYGYPPQQPYGYPQQAGAPYPPQQQPWAPTGPQLQPPYAGWFQRAGAFLLDVLINFGPLWVMVGISTAIEESTGESGDALAIILGWVGVLAMIVAVVLQLRLEGRTGQTVGKKVLGIRAIRAADGRMLGVGLALGRRLLQFLNNVVFGLGWWWAIWDAKSQTFADKIANVIVVRADAVPTSQHPGM